MSTDLGRFTPWFTTMQRSWRWQLASGVNVIAVGVLMAASDTSPASLPPGMDFVGNVVILLFGIVMLVRAGYLLHASAEGPAARRWIGDWE